MTIDYNELLSEFEYDMLNNYWIRLEDGSAFWLIDKDVNDIARIVEVVEEEAV